jgi:hypothetical protein
VIPVGPRPEVDEHDRDKFCRSDREMKEIHLRYLVIGIQTGRINSSYVKFASRWSGFFWLEENQYIRPALRESCRIVKAWLDPLLRAIETTFAPPTGYVQMDHQRRPGIPDDQFEARWSDIRSRAKGTLDAFIAYRRAIKESLII